jgi:hypothetical protein
MRIGGALIVIAIGAILTFAVNVDHSRGINVNTIGVILMIVGAVWALAEIVYASTRRRTDIVTRGPGESRRTTYLEDRDPGLY